MLIALLTSNGFDEPNSFDVAGVMGQAKAGGWAARIASAMSPRTLQAAGLAIVAALAHPAPHAQAAPAKEPASCHVGAYTLADGGVVDIAPVDDERLRWRRFDGLTGELRPQKSGAWRSFYGWTGRADGRLVSFAGCGSGAIDFDGTRGRRIELDVAETRFAGRDGIALAGRLVTPKGEGRVPIVVLVHGAERESALNYYFLQRLFAAKGIGVFVYDKRGTGTSGGTYTQDFDLLADDAVAAMRAARRLAGARAGRVGYQGGSQGGWVAPLAANRAPVDFVIVSFGLAVSVLDEDQQQIEMELVDKGYPREVIAKAQEVGRAAGAILASRFQTGFEAFDAVREKYRHQGWYKDLHGHFTWALLPHTSAQIQAMAADYDWGTPFRYDPMPTLRAGTTPQLWILGERDYEAPSKETSRRIRSLIEDDKPFTLALYPGAEHGMTLFETVPDGTRLSTRYPAGYFRMMHDFIMSGRIVGPYGDATVESGNARK